MGLYTKVCQYISVGKVILLSAVSREKMFSGPEVIKLFSCSTQLSMKFHSAIKIKIQEI